MQYECENCEASLTTGWLVCPHCGEKFDSPVPEYVDTVTPSVTVPSVCYDLAGNELRPAPTVSPVPVAASVSTVSPAPIAASVSTASPAPIAASVSTASLAPIASPKIPIYEERVWMLQAASFKPKFYEEWTFLPNSPLKIGAVVGLIFLIWCFNTWQHRRYVASEGNYEQNGAAGAIASPVPSPPAQTTPQAPAMSPPLVLLPRQAPSRAATEFTPSPTVATVIPDQQSQQLNEQSQQLYRQREDYLIHSYYQCAKQNYVWGSSDLSGSNKRTSAAFIRGCMGKIEASDQEGQYQYMIDDLRSLADDLDSRADLGQ